MTSDPPVLAPKPNMPGHPTGAATHRYAAHRRRKGVEGGVIEGQLTHRDFTFREESIVFFRRREDGVPYGQRGLRKDQHDDRSRSLCRRNGRPCGRGQT